MTGLSQPSSHVRFADRGDFARELEASVDAYLERAPQPRRDVPRMYLKTALILGWSTVSWVALVFVAHNAWQALLCALSLGFSVAAIGMSIQHDANHGAYSRHTWVNRVFGATLDVMGICSFIWRPKHNIAHHTFTNIQGIDYDIDFGFLARLAPEQKRQPWHRFQHVYLWLLYGLLIPKWVLVDDFIIVKRRMIGVHKLPPPSRAAMAGFIGWKLFFVGWSIVLPAFFHPLWQVLIFHSVVLFTLGVTLGTMFQLAHCADGAEFPLPPPRGQRMEMDWATHQLATTVDFAPDNSFVTWFVGGLNYQVEHHLFPKVCHLHYPALSSIVKEVAARHGLRHRSHGTFVQALAAHVSHLRRMGRASPVFEAESEAVATIPRYLGTR